MSYLRAVHLFGSLVVIIVSGTVFFRLVEGWSWLDAYFFTIVTVSTVGYGSLVPATAAGKIGATIFIMTGIGVFAVAIQRFGAYTLQRREEQIERVVRRLAHDVEGDARRDLDDVLNRTRPE